MDIGEKESDRKGLLEWPELVREVLLRRYKRFLADVKLVMAHCANTGIMQGCAEPGRAVYLSRHDNPGRKLKYTCEQNFSKGNYVGPIS